MAVFEKHGYFLAVYRAAFCQLTSAPALIKTAIGLASAENGLARPLIN